MNHCATPRFDIYSNIHKALRALMADTLVRVGRMDVDDLDATVQVVRGVLQMLDLCRAHAEHEDRFIHPVLEARAPGTSRAIACEHADHDAEAQRIGAAANALLECSADQRAPAAAALYRALALFIASNFVHQHMEETVNNAVLWAHCTDAEIMSLHGAMVGSIAPAELMPILRWLVPNLAPAERAATVRELRIGVPPAAFTVMMDMVQAHLPASDWHKLARALDIEHPYTVEA